LLVSIFLLLAGVLHADSSAAQTLAAQITYPADGAVGADLSQAIQWTPVANVQAYYLYVGSTLGANDLVNTGEIQRTSYVATTLPPGQTVFARLYTFAGGVWLYTDSTFSAAPISTITYPANGATNADLSKPIQWTTVANAQAYYLYVGSTLGTNDIVNTGEIQRTSYVSTNLPFGQTVYVRLYTLAGGAWLHADSTFSATSTATATITYPANGATNADLSQPIQWTAVAGAQAYYLYVGSTLGTNDLVNTGEIQRTSYASANIPIGQTVYVRLYTLLGGAWLHADSIFSGVAAPTAPVTATITYPANGATSADLSQPIQWTTVANAQAYYLYVGSTLGTNDLVNTGEIQKTAYSPTNLPVGQTVYARLYTLVGDLWLHADSTFSAAPTAPVTATITYPANGATNANLSQSIRWTTVANAQAYYLYVGSTLGASDLVNTGEILQTSYATTNIPTTGQAVYARLYTELGGVWGSTDSSFTAQALTAGLTYPTAGTQGVTAGVLFTWNAIPNADAYFLSIGTTPGAQDVASSDEIQTTTYLPPSILTFRTLYARLSTEVGGVWRQAPDVAFVTGSLAAQIIFPIRGSVGVLLNQPFEWTTVSGAQGYRLVVSSTAAGSDILDTGTIQQTTYTAASLPADRILYGRVYTLVNGTWWYADTVFTLMSVVPPAAMSYPTDGMAGVDTGQPLQWNAVDIADGYRLELGTLPGANDLHDSGTVRATRRFVPDVPTGVTIYGRLSTSIGGQWTAQAFTFTAVTSTIAATTKVTNALWATHAVWSMAPLSGSPLQGSPQIAAELSDVLSGEAKTAPVCTDYALELQSVLAQMNIGSSVQILNVALNPNGYDGHTLVEMQNDDTGRWMMLDPTFDLSVKRASDGEWATADEMSIATVAGRWSDMSYEFTSTSGDKWVRQYYLDYPLLFVDVYHWGQDAVNGVGGAVLPYLTPAAQSATGAQQVMVVGCSGTTSAELLIDGTVQTLDCSGVNQLSHAFLATNVGATSSTPASLTLYSPLRFVF
jgi:hypothetical protein